VVVYRCTFDRFGFCDFTPLNSPRRDRWRKARDAYRRLWLSDLAGYAIEKPAARPSLSVLTDDERELFEGIRRVVEAAEHGTALIDRLLELILNPSAAPAALGETNNELNELDRRIEQLGFHFTPLNPVTRMFIFAKENLVGTDPAALASQMKTHYQVLGNRCRALAEFYC